MRLLRRGSCLLALCSLMVTPNLARAGGVGADGMETVLEGDFQKIRLPVSAAAARTWIALHETMVKPAPDQTPLGEVIQSLKAALRVDDGKPSEIELYLDPISLNENEISLKTPIPSLFLGEPEVSLHTYLTFLFHPYVMTHRVHDKLVIIEDMCDDCPGETRVSAPEVWTWLLLHEVIPLKFPDDTPLGDVLRTIQRATVGKGKDGRGLVIHVDPPGLREQEKDLSSTVTIDLERAPLCTALGLMLKQLGLGFYVRDDGVLVITSNSDENNGPMDEAEAIKDLQMSNYDHYWDRRNDREEMRQRIRELSKKTEPTGPAQRSETGRGVRSPRLEHPGAPSRHRCPLAHPRRGVTDPARAATLKPGSDPPRPPCVRSGDAAARPWPG